MFHARRSTIGFCFSRSPSLVFSELKNFFYESVGCFVFVQRVCSDVRDHPAQLQWVAFRVGLQSSVGQDVELSELSNKFVLRFLSFIEVKDYSF